MESKLKVLENCWMKVRQKKKNAVEHFSQTHFACKTFHPQKLRQQDVSRIDFSQTDTSQDRQCVDKHFAHKTLWWSNFYRQSLCNRYLAYHQYPDRKVFHMSSGIFERKKQLRFISYKVVQTSPQKFNNDGTDVFFLG